MIKQKNRKGSKFGQLRRVQKVGKIPSYARVSKR